MITQKLCIQVKSISYELIRIKTADIKSYKCHQLVRVDNLLKNPIFPNAATSFYWTFGIPTSDKHHIPNIERSVASHEHDTG